MTHKATIATTTAIFASNSKSQISGMSDISEIGRLDLPAAVRENEPTIIACRLVIHAPILFSKNILILCTNLLIKTKSNIVWIKRSYMWTVNKLHHIMKVILVYNCYKQSSYKESSETNQWLLKLKDWASKSRKPKRPTVSLIISFSRKMIIKQCQVFRGARKKRDVQAFSSSRMLQGLLRKLSNVRCKESSENCQRRMKLKDWGNQGNQKHDCKSCISFSRKMNHLFITKTSYSYH